MSQAPRLGLWQHILTGLRAARSKYGDRIQSVGVDTWGVDFALLGRDDVLLGNPVSYRDKRTEGMMDRAIAQLGREEIFAHTGLQFMPINTLYQFMGLAAQNSPWLEAAKSRWSKASRSLRRELIWQRWPAGIARPQRQRPTAW